MTVYDKKHYAYSLIQLMKSTKGRHLDDTFLLSDFDLYEMRLIDSAIGRISVIYLQDILHLIERTHKQLWKNKQEFPTYEDMRKAFEPDGFYYRKEVLR